MATAVPRRGGGIRFASTREEMLPNAFLLVRFHSINIINNVTTTILSFAITTLAMFTTTTILPIL